ncbi:ankyrin repeats (3 copies) domain-containing protein [Hirsutella rhossiliensis]|uniref:Ankyrin repeats (3 copies) domain-containing protein n=1 Tax=Hirsutella rhossiliensis TaxID=111463 RepID=A0A9P8SI90_9HYPO|nr:ankyrin repeats (3 copies) domain-containing protein [Hirsutella rhossiliensis]KAH0961776.1 ankyrin repeats (3 copies) domain-containing protein [Hirsutella rhossiliensis]
MQTTVLKLLEQLKDTANKSIEVARGLRPPLEEAFSQDADPWEDSSDNSSSDDSDQFNTKTELGQNMSEMTQILSDLFRLSFNIRNPTARSSTQSIIKAMLHKEMVQIDDATSVDLLNSYSRTEGTAYDLKLDDNLDNQSAKSYATTAYGIDGTVAELPQPPSTQPKQSEFTCQYCWVVCPVRDAKGKCWREHILQDLQPYLCTYADCQEPLTMYASRKTWLDHEAQAHRKVWRCFEHIYPFKSKGALKHHLEMEHRTLGKAQIQGIVDLGQATVKDERTTCPFCLSKGPFQKDLANHMAHHMEKLACFAAPRNFSAGTYKGPVSAGIGSTNNAEEHSRRGPEELMRVANWLTPIDYSGEQKDLIHRRQEGTGQWLLESKEFQAWVHQPKDLQEQVKNAIVGFADGLFLRAELLVDTLMKNATIETLQADLATLRVGYATVGHFYEDAMGRIARQSYDQRQLAMKVLLWITCAKRRLKTAELQHALAVKPGDVGLDEDNLPQIEDIVSVCTEFTRELWFPDADVDIAMICVTYLSFDVFHSGICETESELKERLQLYPLYGYASCQWGHHVGRTSTLTLHPVVMEFLKDTPKVEASSQALLRFCRSDFTRDREQMGGLHLTAYFDLWDLFEALFKNDANFKGSNGRTPLSWAAESGKEAVVDMLLASGASIDTGDAGGRTPLSWAAYIGQKAVVHLLLANGTKTETCDVSGRTPLSWAVESEDETVVSLLIASGANIETRDTSGRTPLLWAARLGQDAIVHLLLAKGADPKISDTGGRTPLSWAVEFGHEAVIKLLQPQE